MGRTGKRRGVHWQRAFRLVLQIDPDNHYASEGLARLAGAADRGLRTSQS